MEWVGEPKEQVGKKTFYSEVLISGNKVINPRHTLVLFIGFFTQTPTTSHTSTYPQASVTCDKPTYFTYYVYICMIPKRSKLDADAIVGEA